MQQADSSHRQFPQVHLAVRRILSNLVSLLVLKNRNARKCTSDRENEPENYLSDTITVLKSR